MPKHKQIDKLTEETIDVFLLENEEGNSKTKFWLSIIKDAVIVIVIIILFLTFT
jgi:hypothetical protein